MTVDHFLLVAAESDFKVDTFRERNYFAFGFFNDRAVVTSGDGMSPESTSFCSKT